MNQSFTRAGMVSLCLAAYFMQAAAQAQTPAQLFSHPGEEADSGFGFAIAAAGDLNADGWQDYVVGSPGYDADPGAGITNTGRAYAVSGHDGSVLWVFKGEPIDQAFFGDVVSGGGDIDNDGFDDVLIGGQGELFIYSGRHGGLLQRYQPAEGWRVSALEVLGDVNGDGHDDYLASSTGPSHQAGQVELRSGADATVLYQITGAHSRQFFGFSLAVVDDLDSDGFADFIVGSIAHDFPQLDEAGSVRVYSGRDGSFLDMIRGTRPFQKLGLAIAGVGDLNHDGHGDFLIGDTTRPGPGLNAGIVKAHSGLDRSVIATWKGTANEQRFGSSVAGPGDVDGDGTPDVLIGAYSDPSTGTRLGASFVYSGATRTVIWRTTGISREAIFPHGGRVRAVGDLDQDGYADFAVGGPDESGVPQGGADVGWVIVYAGKPALELGEPVPGQAGVHNDLTTHGTQAGERVRFFASKKPAYSSFTSCPTARRLILRNPVNLGHALTAAGGRATLSVLLPGRLSGQRLYLQAAHLQTCTTSNPITVELP